MEIEHETATVWVIGAGMSVGAGIPAMNELTRLVLSERYMLGGRNELAHFCGFAFPGADLHLDMDGAVTARTQFRVNIEELMTSIDAFGASVQRTKPIPRPSKAAFLSRARGRRMPK